MKAVTADRDRYAADKLELIAKANALSKELDALYEQSAATKAERDSLRQELDAITAERDGLRRELGSVITARDQATAAFARANKEIDDLRSQIEAAPKPDPAVVLADFASEKTKALVARARAAIPADSPALPWFDRAVSALTTAGIVSVKITRETVRWLTPRVKEAYAWAKPRALELYAKAKKEIEAKLASKE